MMISSFDFSMNFHWNLYWFLLQREIVVRRQVEVTDIVSFAAGYTKQEYVVHIARKSTT
jgi:hypothetical protein